MVNHVFVTDHLQPHPACVPLQTLTRYDAPARSPYCSTSDRSAILGDIEQAKAAGMAVDEQCLRRRPEADTDRHLAVTGAYL